MDIQLTRLELFNEIFGYYSEEALEARNKDKKYIRLFHTRKISRVTTLTDQFNRLLVTSDPIISTISNEAEDEIKEEIEKSVDNNNNNEMEIDDEESDIHHVFEILLNADSNIIGDIEKSDLYDDN
ncbi:unnamed protein product [Brachionus calyciflorus]|uniref:Uncharacterized protein n=1 Tax=Brachionus calyciflorus TaxID=104777 RepID=A0A814E791_9BILA|nr:unnamed protein product [Brachionus calyciflorus]